MDEILKRRKAPPMAPSNLAQLIIDMAAARPRPANQIPEIRAWFDTLWASLLIPRPAVAMVLVLLIGLMFGASIEGAAGNAQDDQLSFVYTEDNFNTGEWL